MTNLHLVPGERIERFEPRYNLVPFNQLTVDSEPDYLVKGLIPSSGLVLIWGPPKTYKTFWAFDLMLHIALGWKYRGRKVRGGPVVYCGLEGGTGHNKRAAAFIK